MTIDEIKASGLLELYALGQLSATEHARVQEYLATYPSLRKDLQEIEKALEIYAQSASLRAPADTKQHILDTIWQKQTGAGVLSLSGNVPWRIAAAIVTFIALGLLYLHSQRHHQYIAVQNRLATVLDSCSQQNQQYLAQIELYRLLIVKDNEIFHMTGTKKYPETDLSFHHNPVTKRNFIEVRQLPAIAENQSYQLWSIKPDAAPIPLDVFQGPADPVFEVRHIEATQSYAITIEPRGGQDTPTLENLIGIVTVGG